MIFERLFCFRLRGVAICVAVVGCCFYSSPVHSEPAAVERAFVASQGAVSSNGMVASGHRLASEAGVEILQMGGNAVDAGVAAAFVLGVVDTGNAGLGGGGGMLIWLAEEKQTEFADFYSRASGSEREEEGAGRNVAIPGNAAGLLDAHARHGRLTRDVVLEPSIRLAREGFAVPVNLSASLASHQEKIENNAPEEAAALFFPEGDPLQPGDWLVQEDKAATLERVAAEGSDGFYKGPVAERLVADLNAAGNPLTLDDLAGFETRWLRPLAGGFRDYTVLSAPPPLGGTQVVQSLVLLDQFGLREHGLPAESSIAAGRIVDAIRLARRDYSRWIHDPDTPVPAVGMISRSYASERAGEVGAREIPSRSAAGEPWDFEADVDVRFAHLNPWLPSERIEAVAETEGEGEPVDEHEHTTHLSVIDSDRNAVAITMTLGPSFGAGFYSSGVFFNNGLTRFGSSPEGNRWAAHRTPRSNTSPTIVLEGDDVRMVAGAQGGSRIPVAVVFNILYALEYGLSAGEAMAGPRAFPYINSAVVRVEAGFENDTLIDFRRRGYKVEPYGQQDTYFGGAHTIVVRPDGRLHGAADLRRAGTAVGY